MPPHRGPIHVTGYVELFHLRPADLDMVKQYRDAARQKQAP
jgi:hypothetical protein